MRIKVKKVKFSKERVLVKFNTGTRHHKSRRDYDRKNKNWKKEWYEKLTQTEENIFLQSIELAKDIR